jgi:hypothetical protein
MDKQERQRMCEAQGQASHSNDPGATQANRRVLIPSSKAVAAKMVNIFRQEIGVLINKRGWSDEDKKAFARFKEAIQIVEGAR